VSKGDDEMRYKSTILMIAITLLVASCGKSPSTYDENLGARIRSVENGLRFNETINNRMEELNVPGMSLAVVNNFKLEWAKGYGVVELGKEEPVTADTLFQAASISKPVTAVTSLHLVEQGLIDLDGNINQQLVSWKVPENEFTGQADVTLRRLLSHTAGINQGLNRGYAPGEAVPTLLQALDGKPPANSLPVRVDRVPGTEEYYSNGGYLVVVQLLEDVLGKPFTQITNDAVFDPIGMTSSTFEQQLPADLKARIATPHGWDIETWKESPGLVGKPHINDPGYNGLWTTASDLALFTAEIMKAYNGTSDAVLSQDISKLMLTSAAENIPLQEPYDADQALGFSLIDIGEETWFIHFGGSFPGYISGLIAQPERGFAIVVMTNAWRGYDLIWEVWYSIFYEYGILPSTSQILNMGYSLVLFLVAVALWPLADFVRKIQIQKLRQTLPMKDSPIAAKIARVVLLLTVTGILILTLSYRGPLGGALVPDRGTGHTPLTKAMLGIFFSIPVLLLIYTILTWLKRFWTKGERVRFTLVVLAALMGVFLIRDLWGLMFWM
jgi:CubicO group peptidase (beta-lactamase class C family)